MKLQHGHPGDTRIDEGDANTWIVECVDANGVWVLAEPGMRYHTQDEAEESAEEHALSAGGEFLGVRGSLAEREKNNRTEK